MNADQGDIVRRRRANGCGLDEPAIRLSDGQLLAFWAILTQAVRPKAENRHLMPGPRSNRIGVHPAYRRSSVCKKHASGRTRAVAAREGLPSTPLFA